MENNVDLYKNRRIRIVHKQCNQREILDKSFLLYSNKHVCDQREFQFQNNTIVTLHKSVKHGQDRLYLIEHQNI